VALTSTEPGRIVMTSHCKHIPGGIWGAAFSMLLDQAECSMVRQQVGTSVCDPELNLLYSCTVVQ